jgi:hypothetical protein
MAGLSDLQQGWSNAISIIATAVVTVIAVVAYQRSLLPGAPSSAPTLPGALSAVFAYVPHALILFGVLADMFTYQGVYAISSGIALLSIPANTIFGYFWSGLGGLLLEIQRLAIAPASGPVRAGVNVVNSFQRAGAAGGITCDSLLPEALSALKSNYASSSMVLTATFFIYYLIDLVVNRGWVSATATIFAFAILFGGQAVTLSCESTFGHATVVAISLLEGLFLGGTAYSIVQAYYPSYLPTAAIVPYPRKTAGDLTRNEDGRYTDESGNLYFVLPNGSAVPDLSTPESRAGFAGAIAAASSTGAPAIDASCPAPAT